MKTLRVLTCSLCLCLLFLPGCRSGTPGSMSHASVQIPTRPTETIQQTTIAVFREQGYTLTRSSMNEMIFDRPGTAYDAAKWGGWSGQGVMMRVKVNQSNLGDGTSLLEADAYAVQNSSDPFFQTESRNITLNRVPYQNMLNEVANRLKATP